MRAKKVYFILYFRKGKSVGLSFRYLTIRPLRVAKVFVSKSGGDIPVTVSTRTLRCDTLSSSCRTLRLLLLEAARSSCAAASSGVSCNSESRT